MKIEVVDTGETNAGCSVAVLAIGEGDERVACVFLFVPWVSGYAVFKSLDEADALTEEIRKHMEAGLEEPVASKVSYDTKAAEAAILDDEFPTRKDLSDALTVVMSTLRSSKQTIRLSNYLLSLSEVKALVMVLESYMKEGRVNDFAALTLTAGIEVGRLLYGQKGDERDVEKG